MRRTSTGRVLYQEPQEDIPLFLHDGRSVGSMEVVRLKTLETCFSHAFSLSVSRSMRTPSWRDRQKYNGGTSPAEGLRRDGMWSRLTMPRDFGKR